MNFLSIPPYIECCRMPFIKVQNCSGQVATIEAPGCPAMRTDGFYLMRRICLIPPAALQWPLHCPATVPLSLHPADRKKDRQRIHPLIQTLPKQPHGTVGPAQAQGLHNSAHPPYASGILPRQATQQLAGYIMLCLAHLKHARKRFPWSPGIPTPPAAQLHMSARLMIG
jgi:hypothetical protein